MQTTPHSPTRLLVDRQDIRRTTLATAPAEALAGGLLRLRIDRYAMTANNITYAATGEALKYWQFFPADRPWGCVPCWGFGTVVESRAPGIEVGERLWGFLPMATEVLLQPERVTPLGFLDGAPHRQGLAAVYNSYSRCAADPLHRDGEEDLEALLRPLFMTAWLIADFLADKDHFGARVALLSSASSKTACATASRLALQPGLEVVGLTAARNAAFVRSLGVYSRVLTYEELDALDGDAPSVYIDFAGNAALRREVHTRLKDLRHSAAIGGAHVSQLADITGGAALPGPKATFFFAPKQVAKRSAEWGGAVLMQRLGLGWRQFIATATQPGAAWVEVQQHAGMAGAQAAYLAVLGSQGDARAGHMVQPQLAGGAGGAP
jgi:hypothetical protein